MGDSDVGEEDRDRRDREDVQAQGAREVAVDEGVERASRPAAGAVEAGHPVKRAEGSEGRRPRVDEDEDEEDEKKGPEGEERLSAPPPGPVVEIPPEHATS